MANGTACLRLAGGLVGVASGLTSNVSIVTWTGGGAPGRDLLWYARPDTPESREAVLLGVGGS